MPFFTNFNSVKIILIYTSFNIIYLITWFLFSLLKFDIKF